MSNGAVAASAGAASVAAAIANAIKASGVLVRVKPEEFLKIISKAEAPLVVITQGGFFSANFSYLSSYKGLAFYAKSDTELPLPKSVEVISAKKIWIPG